MLPTYIKQPDGTVLVNPAKRYVKPYWLTTEPVTVALGAGATSAPTTMPIDTQGHFEAFYAMTERTGAATLTIFDPGTSRFMMNREIHIDTIVSGLSGNAAQRPFIWPESYFFNVEDAGRSVVVQFRDLTGAPNDIRFSLHGRRFYSKEAPPEIYKKMYEYFGRRERTNVYFLTTDNDVQIPANGNAVAPCRVTDEGDFEIFKVCAVSDGPFEVTIRDRGSGRALMNNAVTDTLSAGNAEFPFIFVEPWLVERNYQIQLEFTDLSGADNDVWWTFVGRRLWYAQ